MVINDIFEEYRNKKNTLEISIGQMKQDLGDMAERIVLYGAGSAGIAFFYYLQDVGIHPICFADGDPNKWGTVCEGLRVIDYRDIVKEAGKNALVIVTINTDGKKYCKSFAEALRISGHVGVYKNLREAGCENIIDYTYFRRCRKLFQGDKYNLPSCSDVYLMEDHEKELCEVYSLLADDKSREVYEKLLRFRMLDDRIKIPTETQDKQYFEYEFYSRRSNEVFVDCGAFTGTSLDTFLKENNNQFRGYYGFEPDSANYKLLKEHVLSLPIELQKRIKIEPKAVYDTCGSARLYTLHGPGSFLADIGEEKVKTTTIDTALGGEKASYIKMNIEGSELQALKGSEKTITNYKPRLAIAGYHKTWDLWKVPLLIYRFNSGYKFYLRSYMNHLSFVYYGI